MMITVNILFNYKGEFSFVNPFYRAWLIAGLSWAPRWKRKIL